MEGCLLQSISKETIALVADKISMQNANHMAIMVLVALSKTEAEEIAKYDDDVIKQMRKDGTFAAQGGQLLVALSDLSQVNPMIKQDCT